MKKSIYASLLCVMLVSLPAGRLASQDTVDDVGKRSDSKRADILERNRQHREKILKKFYDFSEKIKQYNPRFKMKLPVSPDRAEDIIDNKSASKKKKDSLYSAYVREPYRLRSKPSDSDRNYGEKVRRGDRMDVVLIESAERTKSNMTRDWCLARTGSQAEGYIPLNLLSKDRESRPSFVPGPEPGFSLANAVYYQTDDAPAIVFAGDESPSGEGSANKFVVNVDTRLYMRSEPNQQSAVMGELSRGDIVELVRYGDAEETLYNMTAKWAFVRSQGNEGWVFSAFLKRAAVDADDDPKNLRPGASLYVKSALLRVRDEPGGEGTVITSIPHQKKVEIKEVMDEIQSIGKVRSKWVRIQCDDFGGWVFGGFLSRSRDAFVEDDEIERQFIFPIDGYRRISSPFGFRASPIGGNKGKQEFHQGIDIPAQTGTPIQATSDGFVITAQENQGGYGLYVILEHRDGTRSLYGHMSKIQATVGQKVKTGEVIGLVGATGRASGPHLHFEIILNGQNVNPEQYIHTAMDLFPFVDGMTAFFRREDDSVPAHYTY
ncbi:MAG: peptidoglycan DD-metalloendopeptidase family protein [Spirochaetes bacterium]|jgi:murein DD-endopeptidase MepM/ murein hydrolase activator NlpD|nr:peptidoglycan DD-metalloendopeptidase family protein [Spirochaetota bacterium]